MQHERPLQSIPDDELLQRLAEILAQSRRSEVHLVTHIAGVDERRLYAREACPSMYAYCTQFLHLSEAEAYLRITTGRAARQHPMLLAMLADGRLHLSGIARLAPHLTLENRDWLLARAVHKTKRQILEMLAELFPRPDVPGVMRKLPQKPIPARSPLPVGPRLDGVPAPPEPATATTSELGLDRVPTSPEPATLPVGELGLDRGPGRAPVLGPPAVVEPLSPARYKVQFTAGAELHDKLERLRALLRHEVPDGDLAAIIDKAVSEKLERLEARRFARVKSPRRETARREPAPASRYLSAAIRRAVDLRDKGQCRFVDAQDRRCPERHQLEYHHRLPYGRGGGPGLSNICLMCRTHNRLMAELDYGKEAMSRYGRGRPLLRGTEDRNSVQTG